MKLHVRDLFWLVLVCALTCALLVRNRHVPLESPHGEALLLVLHTMNNEIQQAEGQLALHGAWWHDTDTRTWTVKRPFGPGLIDSTHWFHITYLVDGREAGSWIVDTDNGSVQSSESEQP